MIIAAQPISPEALAGMPAGLQRLYTLLQERIGKKKAIRLSPLYEAWSGEKFKRDKRGKVIGLERDDKIYDVPTITRPMRYLIDDLRDIYGVPIMSSTRAGYWIVADEKELEKVYREHRRRGLKSLATAARMRSNSLADEMHQIEMELRRSPT